MSPVQTVTCVSGLDTFVLVPLIGLEPTTPPLRIVFDPALTMLDGIYPGRTQLDNTLICNGFLLQRHSISYERVSSPFIPLPY